MASTASAVELDSSAFNHQYNGDIYPVPGYTENPGGGTWAPATNGNGLLIYQQNILDSGHWQNDEWLGGPNAVANATGWTIEFRIRIRNDADDDATGGAFNVFAKDGNGTSSTGRRAAITVGRNWTKAFSFNTGTQYSTVENTNDFHVFRYAQPPNSRSMTLWRDGVQLYSGDSRPSNDNSNVPAQMYFGDGSSGTGGPTVEIDYIRWDSTGFYEPVVVPPGVVQSPQNTTNAVGASVTFTAVFTNAITSVQWYKDNNPISPNTFSSVSSGQQSTYTIAALQPGDEGTYHCVGANSLGFTNTAVAYLDVLTDVSPPTVVTNAVSPWARRVRVKFSEPTDPVSTGEPTNYVFQGGALSVASVTVLDSTRADVFTTTHPLPGSNYVLQISNVQDTSANAMPNTPVAFTVDNNFPARTNLLIAFNETSAMANPGGGVAWRDLSGNENHAVNPTTTGPTLVPNGLQGHGVYHFTPANTTPRLRVLGAEGTGLTETSYTWFVVARCSNRGTGGGNSLTPISPMVFNYYSSYEPANWNCYFYNGGPETTNAQAQVEQGVVFAGRDDPADAEVAAIPHPVPGDSWYILVGHVDLATGAIGRVLSPSANTIVSATNTTAPLGLGLGIPNALFFGSGLGGNNRFGGDMAEILIYTGSLSQSDWDSIENYLRVKYFAPFINVQPNGANLEINFSGVLQSSTNGVNGTYYDVSGSPASPYVVTPGNQLPQQYFRSRYP